MAISKWHAQRQNGVIEGRVQVDRLTKRLLKEMTPGSIAVLWHDDLDALAAEGLIRAGTAAVINAGRTMTGKIPGHGALLLLENNIPIVEIDPIWFPKIANLKEVHVYENEIVAIDEGWIIPCRAFTRELWLSLSLNASSMVHEHLSDFIDNTLAYAQKEREIVLKPLECPEMRTELAGKPVLVVVRGREYKQDLAALRGYITSRRPVLIGVDGGADALLEQGYVPDLIVGDMDSVSDAALQCGAELIVHAYSNGQAPGMMRLRAMGLQAIALSSCGTSEDMTLLLAYDQHCDLIITVGLHSSMYDFLEKARPGMGSTLLVRMKVGSKLTDATGIGKLISSAAVAEGLHTETEYAVGGGRIAAYWTAMLGRLKRLVGKEVQL